MSKSGEHLLIPWQMRFLQELDNSMLVRVFHAAVRLVVNHLVAACCHFLTIYRRSALTEVRPAGQDAEEVALCSTIKHHLCRARKVQRRKALMQKLMADARGMTVADHGKARNWTGRASRPR